MLTQDEVDRKTARKAQLETEVQGTTEQRKAEIEAELVQINADLDAHRRETSSMSGAQTEQRVAQQQSDDRL